MLWFSKAQDALIIDVWYTHTNLFQFIQSNIIEDFTGWFVILHKAQNGVHEKYTLNLLIHLIPILLHLRVHDKWCQSIIYNLGYF